MSRHHTTELVEGTPHEGVWQCRDCSRRIFLRFDPHEKIVMDHGDESLDVTHSGSGSTVPGVGLVPGHLSVEQDGA
jgi:hypothetical protein